MNEPDFGGHDLREVIAPEPDAHLAPNANPSTPRHWWYRRPYLSALIGAGILIGIGGLIVFARSPASLSGSNGVWSGASANILNPSDTGNHAAQDVPQYVPKQTVSYGYVPISRGTTPEEDTSTNGSFDFNAFMAELTQENTPPNTPGQSGADSSPAETYSFIPKGFVAVGTPTSTRNAVQQALFNYGNEAGSLVESFETAHRDQAQVLKNWLEDRSDTTKAAAVVQLGRALWETGKAMLSLDTPETAAAANKALADSYMEIGANLALVPKTERDTDLLKAIETYNASADTFTKNYIALVNIFGAYDVQFSASDPGSAFTFKPVSL